MAIVAPFEAVFTGCGGLRLGAGSTSRSPSSCACRWSRDEASSRPRSRPSSRPARSHGANRAAWCCSTSRRRFRPERSRKELERVGSETRSSLASDSSRRIVVAPAVA
eukprot:scaffold43665_cov70-Phaeocystis_antarctica.AAC.2